MRNIILTTLSTLLLFCSCKKEINVVPIDDKNIQTDSLIADFDFDIIIKENEPNVYQFKNLSKNASSYKWYFNNSDTSSLFEPSMQYSKLDTYYVKLVVSANGESKTKFKAIIVKNIIGFDANKNPIYASKPIADFKIIHNIDSAGIVFFQNLSTGSTKATWSFSNGKSSSEINPVQNFNSNLNAISATLYVEDRYGVKDSIKRSFNLLETNKSFNSLYYLLTNTSAATYSFYQDEQLYDFYNISGISFTENYTNNTTSFTNGYSKTFSSTNVQNVVLSIDLPNRTAYKKIKTFDLINIQNTITNLVSNYIIDDRYELAVEGGVTRTTNFNDTTLNINLESNSKLKLNDNFLHHEFTGYLSSYSNDDYLDFRLQNTSIPNISVYNYSYLRFEKNTNKIELKKYQSTGSKTGGSLTLVYKGNR